MDFDDEYDDESPYLSNLFIYQARDSSLVKKKQKNKLIYELILTYLIALHCTERWTLFNELFCAVLHFPLVTTAL